MNEGQKTEAEKGKTRGGVPFFGNGYETIRSLINPKTYEDGGVFTAHSLRAVAWVLVVLLVLKVIATSLTLGSGGSGGVFAPSLFMGATSGAAFGVVLDGVGLLPGGDGGGSPAAYALVGMAAVVGASTHAPLTAILMLFELTRDVYVLLPIMLAAVVATVLAQLLDRDSIYTAKLRRAGVFIGLARDRSILRTIPVSSCRLTLLPNEPVYASDPLSKLIALHAYQSVPDFVVVDAHGGYLGMVTGSDMRAALIDREAIPLLLVAELMRTDLPVVGPMDRLDAVMAKFAQHDVSSLAVVRNNGEIEGLLTRAEMLRRYDEVLDQAAG